MHAARLFMSFDLLNPQHDAAVAQELQHSSCLLMIDAAAVG
jgi:hypothetical protein